MFKWTKKTKKSTNLAIVFFLLFSLVFGSIPVLAVSAARLDVSPLGVDGKTVQGTPAITAVPDSSKTAVKAEFYAKALQAPDSAYFKFPDRVAQPFTWGWATGEPYIPDGMYSLKVVIYYNDSTTDTLTKEVLVNNTIELIPPKSPIQLTIDERTSTKLQFSWNHSTDTDLAYYEVYWNDNKIFQLTGNAFVIFRIEQGKIHKFQVKAVDTDGNVAIDDNSIGVYIPFDNETAPALPVVSTIQATGPIGVTPGSGGYSETVTLSVQETAQVGVDKVDFFTKVYSDEAEYWKFPTTTRSGSQYSVPWATIYAPDGDVIIKATAYDMTGQYRTKTNVFIVDNTPDAGHEPNWDPADTPPSNRVVGYLSSWSTYGAYDIERDVDASRLTHINYAFANVSSDLEVVLGDPAQDLLNFEALSKLKDQYPHLKTLISVGGWEWSDHFSAAAATAETREAFAESAVEFMLEHGFDGVDLDWEYPVVGGGPGTTPNPNDKITFPLLLEEIRNQLDAQGAIDNKHYLLTIAGGASASFANNASLGETHQYLDYITIMTYDIHGPWETRADFTAPLWDANGETFSVDLGVKAFLNAGVPSDKLVMGVPFYGYQYKVTSSDQNGLRQPLGPSGNSSITYKSIINQDLLNSGFTRYWHEGSKVPYLFNPTTMTFISYDDPESIGHKAQYIRDMQLGGAMIWELSQDHEIDLLSVLYDELQEPIVDSTGPVTNHSLNPDTPNGTNGWYTSNVTVTLNAKDNYSGPIETKYRINNGQWQNYNEPFQLGEGIHQVEYYSIDDAGNNEGTIRNVEVKIDKTNPTLQVTLNPSVIVPANNNWVNVQANLQSLDTLSGVDTIILKSVTSSDPGTDNAIKDASIGTLDSTFMVKSEVSKQKNDRTYTIQYEITDKAGNKSIATATIQVNRSRGKTN